MNYNNDNFNYSSLIFNKKYRSRLILAIYTILFIILIIFLRTSINNKNYNESNNEVFINENEDNKNEESENSYIKSLFSYIDMNNYNFEFKISYNNNVYISSGKRSDRKYDFTLTDGNNIVHYLVSGKLVKIKQENSSLLKGGTKATEPKLAAKWQKNSSSTCTNLTAKNGR